MVHHETEQMALLALKIAFYGGSATLGLFGILFGQTALSPTASAYEKAVDGGASVLLLTIAAASMYALLQGKIVPIAAFERRLEEIEESVKEINLLLLKNGEIAVEVRHCTEKAHRELRTQLAAVLTSVERWDDGHR